MSGIYMVSAQKPTAVTHSILGRVTSPTDLNLIICKSTLIEVYKVTVEGLKFLKQISLWGNVENLNIVRLKNEAKDSLLVTTSKYDLMVLSFEVNSDGIVYDVTRTHGNFRDIVPRSSSTHVIACVDSSKPTPLVAIKCYDGILKTIPINPEAKQLAMSTIKMEDLNVVDLVFLHGYDASTIGLICKEPNSKLNFKVYEIDPAKDAAIFLWKKEINDNQAFIIPVPEPFGGVILVGTQAISYVNKNSETILRSPVFLSQGEITNFAQIDSNGQRYLISNTMGKLFLMMLSYESGNTKINDIKFETLGDIAIADNMTYIDNGVVFIGSKLGDSQLIKLIETPNESGSYVDVLETYTNLGPILDMLIVDIEKQGQGQLITCSGGHRNGSLRVIRSGIGIQESANVELAGIKALWPLRVFSNEFDDHLILSFYGYTKIFSFFGEEFEDIELEGFDLANQTLHASNVVHNQLLQVTSTTVKLIKANESSGCRKVAEWRIPEGELISVATSTLNECLLACRNQLYYIGIENESLSLVKSTILDHEIACIDIYSFNKTHGAHSDICAVGLWSDISARLLSIPDLNEIVVEQLKGDVIPRSILIETLEQIPYLFVSLGDGSVISYVIAKSSAAAAVSGSKPQQRFELTERRKVVLGTQPTILKKFHSTKPVESNNIFACSDRPSVISSTNQKLVYSSVNLKQVEFMCQLNAKDYQASLALLSAGTLRIGKMDSIQKLHIRSVPLNETARRIAYQTETQTFGLITFRMDVVMPNGETKPLAPSASTQCPNQLVSKPSALIPVASQSHQNGQSSSSSSSISSADQIVNNPTTSKSATENGSANAINNSNSYYNAQVMHSFLVLDQNTFEVLHSVQFQPNEFATAILSLNFADSSTTASQNDSSVATTGGTSATSTTSTNHYYVVGCCLVNDDEPEPKLGRLIVFKLSENKLSLVCEREIKGAACCMQNFNGRLLVSISNSVRLFELANGGQQLNQIASYSDNVFVTHLKCKNDFILIGDMMKSCAVLTYRAETSTFELVAKDHTPVWLNSCEMIDDDNFVFSDCYQNVLSLKKDSGQSNEEDRKCLQNIGCIHLGDQINVFRHGSLGMQQQSNELLANHFYGNILAGSVSGSIILFAQLSSQMYKILNELQTRLSKFLTTAGKIQYDKWRDFESEKRIEHHKYFIDGDLIESFLELSPNDAANLIEGFTIDNSTIGHSNEEFSVSYFNKLVEELTRLH